METETELRDEWLLSKKINTLSQCTYQTLPLHLNDADTWDVLCITYRPRMLSGTRNISSYMDICGWGVISERVKVAFLFRALQTPPRLNLGVKPQTVISSRVVRCMCKFGLCEWSKRQTTGSRSHSLQPEHFTLLVVGCVQSETAAEAADNQHKRARDVAWKPEEIWVWSRQRQPPCKMTPNLSHFVRKSRRVGLLNVFSLPFKLAEGDTEMLAAQPHKMRMTQVSF